MSKQKTATAGAPSVFAQLFQVGVYKGRQGRVTRQTTWGSLAVIIALACYKLHLTLETMQNSSAIYIGLPLAGLIAGLWIAYRLVNLPRFADFLIAVEAEMKKVSWPTWAELVRSSMVVIFVIFLLALVLWLYDFLWQAVFSVLGIVG
ncbi:MAG: preprotein translocase subunit SecE [Planctomycetales bacterium]|nr:preprotein translocase subunit SecE [Planctomycetales bacterium]